MNSAELSTQDLLDAARGKVNSRGSRSEIQNTRPSSPNRINDIDERNTDRNISARKTMSKTVLSMVLIGGTMFGIAGVGGTMGVIDAMGLHIDSHGRIVKGGQAAIEKIDMKMPPITLSTVDTKVTGEKVAFETDIKALGDLINVPVNQQTLTREASVQTLIRLDPGKVDISYDDEKEKLSFSLPDNTLSTKVDIPTGKSHNSATSTSATKFISDFGGSLANALAGTVGNDASSVPILGDLAKGNMSINNALESFADLAITTGVDKACTPKLQTIDGFDKQLDDNVLTAMKGAIMSNPDVQKKLPTLMDKPLKEVNAILDKASIEMPKHYKISPDETAIASLDKYINSKYFSVAAKDIPPITCGVSKSAKLSLVEKKG